jgi:transposase-like protein
MTKKTIKRYSEALKIQVVREYENGSTVSELRKKYGIKGGQTVQLWIKKYAQKGLRHKVMRIQTADEAKQIKELEAKVEELEKALLKTTLEKLVLESTLEVIEESGELEVKKNAVKSSSGSKPKHRKQG